MKKWLLIVIGSLSWSLVMVKSGLVYDLGLGFWGPNGHDGVWHIALTNSLSRGSWGMPTFAGSILTNYHFGFDLLLAFLHRITTIPTQTLYFQIIPPLLALGIGLLVYHFVDQWQKSKTKAWWATFFVYFGGSWGWLLGKGESAFWAQQAISTLINPPFALSILLIFLGLILLQKKKYLLAALVFGSLIQVKAYAGLLALGGLLIAGIWQLWRQKDKKMILVFLGSLILSLILFLPFNQGATSLLVFKPFWFLETMMQLSDRVGWVKFGEAMINYKWGNVWFKAIPAYLLAFLIFWYGNMGTRFLGEIFIGKRLAQFKKLGWLEVFILSIILAGTAIPMFFLQAGTPWNTIQFFYYSLFLAAILAGIFAGQIKGKLLPIVIVLVTLPTTIITLKNDYLPIRPPAKISIQELDALEFLSNQPEGVVLTFLFNEAKAEAAAANPPRPLYLYESTAYVAAFGNQPVFLEDEVNLDITGYDWHTRRDQVEEFIDTTDQEFAREFLKRNNIRYLYLVYDASPHVGELLHLGPDQLGAQKVFGNDEVDIYKVN